MSVNSEITALEGYLSSAYGKISDMGGTLPQNKNMSNLTTAIDSIPTSSKIIIPPSAGTLTSISVTSNPNKTVYNEGENFDFTGLVITALYSSGNQYDVTNSCTYTMNQPLQYGDSSILVTYESQTTTISITVNAVPVPAPISTLGLYHFNNSLKDEVTGNNGTGGSNYLAGKFGNAVKSDSSFKSVALGISASRVFSESFTIEFWAKAHSNWGYGYYPNSLCFLVYGNDLYPYFFAQSNVSGGLKLDTSNSGIASSSTVDTAPSSFNIKDWNHIALVIVNGNYSLYLNGVKNSHGTLKNRDINKVMFSYESSLPYSNSFALDELLITNNEKYTSNFTPPNAPYYLQA